MVKQKRQNALTLNFNSQKRLTCNFSLKYPYIIQQTGTMNIQTNEREVFVLI